MSDVRYRSCLQCVSSAIRYSIILEEFPPVDAYSARWFADYQERQQLTAVVYINQGEPLGIDNGYGIGITALFRDERTTTCLR